jgi:4-diphosphocytidyl-2-C-methyl-D-erythritol kinase
MNRIEETAFAKINLDLRVRRRRVDGYHDLDSLVAFAAIGDHLTFEPADEFSLVLEGPFKASLSADDNNLAVRAARVLADKLGRRVDVRITLDKRLPVASGLGGGSADAAATLRGVCRLWDLPLSLADLLPLARTLGADVPACLGSTAVRMEGIGDRLSPLTLSAPWPIMLANPGVAVSTSDVFRALQTHSGARKKNAMGDGNGSFLSHVRQSVNDLEATAIEIAPVVDTVLHAIRGQSGCELARMSGSGTTCFGVFDDPADRDRACAKLSSSHPDWWVAGTDVR